MTVVRRLWAKWGKRSSGLAGFAPSSRPARDDAGRHGPLAACAGLSRSTVGEVAGTERPGRSIGKPVVSERRAAGVDGEAERRANGPCEPLQFQSAEIDCRAFGPDAGSKQGFVGVDVPDPRKDLLVEENGLDRSSTPLQLLPKGFSVDECGLGTQLAQNSLIAILGALKEVHPTEASWIDELHPNGRAIRFTRDRPGDMSVQRNRSPVFHIT